MEFIEVLQIGIISFFSVLLALLIFLKIGINRLENSLFFEDLFENILKNVSSDEELQKLLYQVGGILGSGVRSGVGIAAPKTGRFKWQDLAMEIAGQWAQKAIVNAANPSPSPQPQPLPDSKEIITQKARDKW